MYVLTVTTYTLINVYVTAAYVSKWGIVFLNDQRKIILPQNIMTVFFIMEP